MRAVGADPDKRIERSWRGRSRWYLVAAPEGAERRTAERIRRLVPSELLDDAFSPAKERWEKRGGEWGLRVVGMYPGYLFVSTRDVAGLGKALAALSFRAELAGAAEGACAPLAEGAQEFLERAMDAGRVVRGSVGELVGGELRVTSGPLAGQEGRILRWDRRKRWALVDLDRDGGGSVESLALDVPVAR